MKLDFIDHDKLFIDKTNMRYGKKAPDVTDILPTVRKRGVIVPLVVKPANDEGRSGIVAGARRWTADGVARAEGIDHGPLPCAILDPGDDAAAIETSMIENMARLDALGHVGNSVLYVEMRGRPTAALTQRAGGGRPVRRIAQRCLIAA